MKRSLHNRRILITGASRGIGRAIAEQAAADGARLILATRSPAPLTELADQLSGRTEVLAVRCDITAPEDRQQLLNATVERFGGLDVLINNAGVGAWGHFATSTEDILRRVMEVNFFAPAELMRLAIPLLRRGHEPAIVNVASMCGRRGVPAWPEYSAAKFALAGLTEALRAEMARFDMDVLLIVPGLTQSEYFQHLLRSDGRAQLDVTAGMTTEQVAGAILRGLRTRRAETVLGREAKWLLRINRFVPRLVDRLMARKVRRLYAESEAAASV